VSSDGKRLYVSTGRGGEIVAYDAQSLSVLGSVKVGARPWGLALSPDGRILYTANGPSDDISIVATDSLRVEGSITVGKRPWGVAVLPMN
jgi:YVTN family beta-propeller protein